MMTPAFRAFWERYRERASFADRGELAAAGSAALAAWDARGRYYRSLDGAQRCEHRFTAAGSHCVKCGAQA